VSLATTNNSLTQVKASAVVVPAQESRLSFVISGIVEEVLVEEGSQVEAGQALVKLDTTEQDYNVEAAQIALNAAEIDAQIQRQSRRKFNMDTFSFIYVSAPEEKIRASDSKVDQMRSALDATKASLAQATLVAPSNSTVVKVDIAPGEYVHPGQVIVELARLDELQIETTDLSELNVAAVQIGQSATVFVEALDAEFPGKVTAISPISNTIGGDVVFTVTIQLDEQPAALLWGMSADVEINIE
jgi:RND family efflux transporter MFP subunit